MRESHKQDRIVLASETRTADATGSIYAGTIGGLFVIDVTAASATPSVVFTIRGITAEGNNYTILQSAAITATGVTVLKVHPSLTASANSVAKDILPGAIEVFADHADADSITYSVQFIGVN